MNSDTRTIRRLRDGLVERGNNKIPAGVEIPASYQDALLARFAPFAETMYLMMQIDGHSADTELDAIRGAMQVLTDGSLPDDTLNEIFQSCKRDVREHGVEIRLQAVGTRLSTDRVDRETAFTLAAAVAIADHKLEEEEVLLMESIAEWYGISNKRCREILEEV